MTTTLLLTPPADGDLPARLLETKAADFYQSGQLDEDMQSVLASAWISDSSVDKSALIREFSIAQPNYNSVLTMLWADRDIVGFNNFDDEDEAEEEDLDHFTPDGKRWRW
jgi:hypothetical protein